MTVTMLSLIASNSPTVALKLRKALAALGHECPITHVVVIDQIVSTVHSFAKPVDLLLIVLPDDDARCREILRQLRPQTSARIVAVGSARTSRSILDALHAGADDYVDDDHDLLEQVRATMARLAAMRESAVSGRLLVVTSASGGSAASTVATNLAVLLARREGTCGLLDMASGFGDLASLLDLSPRYTLVDLLRNHDTFDSGMFNQSLTPHATGVKLLATANQYDDPEGVTPQLLNRIATISRAQFAWTVADVDCRSRRNHDLVRQAQSIVLTVRLDFASLCNTRRLLDSWKQSQIDRDRVFLVAGPVVQTAEVSIPDAETLLQRKFAGCLPNDPAAANLSANCGHPIVIESPKSVAGRALCQLLRTVCGPESQADPPESATAARDTTKVGLFRRVAGVIF